MKYITILDGEQYEVEIDKDGNITINGEPRDVDFLALGPSQYSIISDNKSVELVMDGEGGNVEVLMGGRMYETQVLDERALMMAQRRGGLGGGSGEVNAPMPGLIVAVPVNAGDVIAKGQTVIILESMKMQNELKSPIDGTVQTVHVEGGQSVDKGQILIVITPAEEE